MVTGGTQYGSSYRLDSTELLIHRTSAWVYSGKLPSPRDSLRAVSLDKRVIITGKGSLPKKETLSQID